MKFSELPALRTALYGGIFAGVTTLPNGTHSAVFLLFARGRDLTWESAKAWAAEQGGELPTRPVAALLFANVRPALPTDWHWTADEYDGKYAWYCYFLNVHQYYYTRKLNVLSAVAVRLIPITE